jgi:hypothetical protein
MEAYMQKMKQTGHCSAFIGKALVTSIAALSVAVLMAFAFSGCDSGDGPGGDGDAAAAAQFGSDYSAVLALTVGSVATTDEETVDAALEAFDELSEGAQALLGDEKDLLDSLKEQITALKTPRDTNITIGFNDGGITIAGSDGSNVIDKSNNDTLELSATGYTDCKWYIDGNDTAASSTTSITINAASYAVQLHFVTFVGTKSGHLYSSDPIPFTVVE